VVLKKFFFSVYLPRVANNTDQSALPSLRNLSLYFVSSGVVIKLPVDTGELCHMQRGQSVKLTINASLEMMTNA
jgi:hypothetical protein